MSSILSVKDLNIYYNDFHAVKDVNLNLEQKEIVVICGPSGSGKSTLIRTIAGLEKYKTGEILVNQKVMSEKEIMKENIFGMVFQQFNLFPHMSALQNCIEAPIEVLGLKREEAEERALELLELVGLTDKKDQHPSRLSGGQQQRVAIARALALKPELLLFDEPTSALDPERINEVLDAMRRLAQQGMTMVVVTHEISFAKEVSDQILFMDSGKVIETSTPDVFFSNAKHERSRKFLNQLDKH